MDMRLASVARNPARPDAAAITVGEATLTYGELAARIDRAARALVDLGLTAGDRVVLLLPSDLAFVVTYFGCHRAGLVALPLNPLVGVEELRQIFLTMGPRAIVAGSPKTGLPAAKALPGLHAEAAPQASLLFTGVTAEEAAAHSPSALSFEAVLASADGPPPTTTRQPEDEAVILFTSGTSGRPKGVSLSERSIMANAVEAIDLAEFTADDVILCPLPLSHVFGQVVAMTGGLCAGAQVEFVPRPAPEIIFEAMASASPTVLLAVPATIAALAKIGAAAPVSKLEAARRRLRLTGSGGGPLPPAAGDFFTQVFAAPSVQGYGMTETAGLISMARLGSGEGKSDVGRVLKVLEHRIDPLDPAEPNRGELQVRGVTLLRGFYIDGVMEPRDPSAWFPTGDLVDISADGRLTIFDRKKELIIRGGYNVYPSEVEATLASHPAVSIAAVIGTPHAELGEDVGAFVTLKADKAVDPAELIDWCRQRLALYKYPRQLTILEAMPLSPTGKVLKRELPIEILGG